MTRREEIMEVKTRILEHAHELFMQLGIRSVTMDEIARGLGISKKTIYQYYGNKADIVYEVTHAYFEEEQRLHDEAMAQAENALHELTLLIPMVIQSMSRVPAHLIHEVRKYYPRAWGLYEAYKVDVILAKVRQNLLDGIQQGLYRSSMNVDLIARSRVAQVEAGLSAELFPPDQFDHTEVQLQMFELYIYGIVSDKGRELLNNYLDGLTQSAPS